MLKPRLLERPYLGVGSTVSLIAPLYHDNVALRLGQAETLAKSFVR